MSTTSLPARNTRRADLSTTRSPLTSRSAALSGFSPAGARRRSTARIRDGELLRVEGLVEVVVSPLVESRRPLEGLPDLGEQHHGCPVVPRAQPRTSSRPSTRGIITSETTTSACHRSRVSSAA